jgi:hypothetical protein
MINLFCKRLAQTLTLVLLTSTSVVGQIAFSPTILFMSDEKPVNELLIRNVTDVPQEVEFIERFGYPVRTPSGTLEMVYDDSISAAGHGLTGMLRIFPRKALIPPRSQQIVRLQVIKNGGENDQMYWTRLGIESRAVEMRTDDLNSDKDSPTLSYLFRQNIGVYYKHGHVHTGVVFNGIEKVDDGENIRLLISASRTGNSPYLGIMTARITNSDERVVSESEQVVNLFFDSTFSVSVDREKVKPGPYKLDITFETTRGDVPEEQLVKYPIQKFSTEFFIQEQAN